MTTMMCTSLQNLTLRQAPSNGPSRSPLCIRLAPKLSASQSSFAAETRICAECQRQAPCQQSCLVTCGKLKTRKAAAKRYKVTGSGKVVFRHPGKQHINEKKSSKRLSQLGKPMLVSDSHLPGIIGNLPYKRITKSGNK